jgi:hypothetical protein
MVLDYSPTVSHPPVSLIMMAAGGFDGPQILARIARQPIADLNTVADNASTGDNQAGCGLLLVFSLVDSSSDMVEGIARLHDWQTIPD